MSDAFLSLLSKHPSRVERTLAKELFSKMPNSYKEWVSEDTFIEFMATARRNTLYWYDYEAGGKNARTAPVMQHAAIRTDESLRVIDEPLDIYCKLHGDKLPHPQAIAITKINPMHCLMNGIPEPVFFRMILAEMSVPSTCSVGYNSMKYDEEMTRFGLWRSNLPVYKREWKDGNSKWDLLSVTTGFRALYPNAMAWPINDKGKVSLKLEDLSSAAGISQENAHNALDDVKALIDWGRFIKKSAPEYWDYAYQHRTKKQLQGKIGNRTVVAVSKILYSAESNFIAPVLILGVDAKDKNKLLLVRLDNVEALRDCWRTSVDDLKERLFMKKSELEDRGLSRPPLDSVKLNQAPMIISEGFLNNVTNERESLIINDDTVKLANTLRNNPDFLDKLVSVMSSDFDNDPVVDPEMGLYASFPSSNDDYNLGLSENQKANVFYQSPMKWDNQTYLSLWQLGRCKMSGEGVNLTDDEVKTWKEHCSMKLNQTPECDDDVYFDNVEKLLGDSDLPEDLKLGYTQFIEHVKSNISQH